MILRSTASLLALCLYFSTQAMAYDENRGTGQITVEGDEFDPKKTIRGPSHDEGVLIWQLAAIKSREKAATLNLIVTLQWIDNGLIDFGHLTGATFKGGASASAVMGPSMTGTCLAMGCLREQTINIELSNKNVIDYAEGDSLPIKINSTKYSKVLKIPSSEIQAIMEYSRKF